MKNLGKNYGIDLPNVHKCYGTLEKNNNKYEFELIEHQTRDDSEKNNHLTLVIPDDFLSDGERIVVEIQQFEKSPITRFLEMFDENTAINIASIKIILDNRDYFRDEGLLELINKIRGACSWKCWIFAKIEYADGTKKGHLSYRR